MKNKPPVVVVLGHIDHGKSTLIDFIRKTRVTAKEVGSITQAIGAYQALTGKNKAITFIDTPGHEAFDAMRKHGAQAADIAILIIAADEGVKPQTIEAIKAIQEAKIPFIVALNKIDKQEANSKKVKEELVAQGVYVEGFGGDVPVAEISAKDGKGVQALLDLVTLMAEVEGLSADPTKSASGVVITSSLDSRRGPVVTVIVKDGTLKEGQPLKLASTYGKVRAMTDAQGKRVTQAGPSVPVEILGLEGLPDVGEEFQTVVSLEEAKNVLPIKKEDVPDDIEKGKVAMSFIVKAKEKASLDALRKLFPQAQTQYPQILLRIVDEGVGDISSADLDKAKRFGAVIIGFDVKIPSTLRPAVQQHGITIRLLTLIYDVSKIIEEIVGQTVDKAKQAEEKAELEILAVFSKSKAGQVIGGKVTKRSIKKSMLCDILRDDSIVGKGKIENLQRGKQDVASVETGKECGMLFVADADVVVGDILKEV